MRSSCMCAKTFLVCINNAQNNFCDDSNVSNFETKIGGFGSKAIFQEHASIMQILCLQEAN